MKKKKKGLFLFIILKEDPVDLHEEAGKENEQTLANWAPPKMLRAEMKSKLRNFCKSRNLKTLNTRLRAIWMRGGNFVSYWKSLEQLQTNLPMSSTLFCPDFSSPFVNKMALSRFLSGFHRNFQRSFLVWSHNKHLINRAAEVGLYGGILSSVAGTDLSVFSLCWWPRSRFSHADFPLG